MVRLRSQYGDEPPEGVFDQDLLDDTVPDDEEPQMIFHVALDRGTHEVEVFLTDTLNQMLHDNDHAAWRGLLEFVEDDLRMGGL